MKSSGLDYNGVSGENLKFLLFESTWCINPQGLNYNFPTLIIDDISLT